MDQEGHLIEAGAVHASVKSRRREEERAAQGYDSTREASEAPAAAGAKVFQQPSLWPLESRDLGPMDVTAAFL